MERLLQRQRIACLACRLHLGLRASTREGAIRCGATNVDMTCCRFGHACPLEGYDSRGRCFNSGAAFTCGQPCTLSRYQQPAIGVGNGAVPGAAQTPRLTAAQQQLTNAWCTATVHGAAAWPH